jgi:endonuclease YncB( thermonuclease family)
MNLRAVWVLAAALLMSLVVAPPSAAESKLKVSEGHAARVILIKDGDTLVVRLQPTDKKLKLRVLGADCPEGPKRADPSDLGQAATEAAKALLLGKDIKLESENGDGKYKHDRFGRLLAFVRLADGVDYGLKMIADGHCGDFSWKYPHPRSAEYAAAEKKTQK